MEANNRRGPSYRAPRSRLSGDCRESLTDLISRRLGISANRAHDLRFRIPALLAEAIHVMREAGRPDAIGAMVAPIDQAVAEVVAPDERIAFVEVMRTEGETNEAEVDYLLDPSEANRQRLLSLSAREQMAEQQRDALLRMKRS